MALNAVFSLVIITLLQHVLAQDYSGIPITRIDGCIPPGLNENLTTKIVLSLPTTGVIGHVSYHAPLRAFISYETKLKTIRLAHPKLMECTTIKPITLYTSCNCLVCFGYSAAMGLPMRINPILRVVINGTQEIKKENITGLEYYKILKKSNEINSESKYPYYFMLWRLTDYTNMCSTITLNEANAIIRMRLHKLYGVTDLLPARGITTSTTVKTTSLAKSTTVKATNTTKSIMAKTTTSTISKKKHIYKPPKLYKPRSPFVVSVVASLSFCSFVLLAKCLYAAKKAQTNKITQKDMANLNAELEAVSALFNV